MLACSTRSKVFSEALAAQIEAPQSGSTRSVYEAKWTIYTKWCQNNHVNLRAPHQSHSRLPPVLFQDRKLQPSTINGYRSAIADKKGNCPLMSARTKISLVSWIVYIQTIKTFLWYFTSSQRLLLNPLHRPLEKSDLQDCLSLSSVFWQEQGEIHAWLNKTSNTKQTGPRCLSTPHPAFFQRISWPKRIQNVWLQW